jgi:hypothetical protein
MNSSGKQTIHFKNNLLLYKTHDAKPRHTDLSRASCAVRQSNDFA